MAAPDGRHFDRVADTYDRGRPPYPATLWRFLAEAGVLGPGRHVLEVGAGSGQATRELLRRGLTVDAVEPGPALASALRSRHPGLRVLEERAEEVDLAPAAYDAVVAATSLHWVDVPAVLPRWHAALRPGGLLAAWWAVFGDPAWTSPFRRQVDAVSRASGNHHGGRTPRPLLIEDRLAELTGGGWFEPVDHTVLPWEVALTADQLGDLFTTFPTWTPEMVAQVVEAARAGADPATGLVAERWLVAAYVVRRR